MYRILICDDEKDIRESTADYMKCEGLSVALASDGYAAVKSVKYREENGKKILELHSFKYGFINKLAGVEFYFEVK